MLLVSPRENLQMGAGFLQPFALRAQTFRDTFSNCPSFTVFRLLEVPPFYCSNRPLVASGVPVVRVKARESWEHVETKLLADLARTMSELPQGSSPQMMEFSAYTAGAAREAAAEWLSNFRAHGPLQIESIRTSHYNGKYVAVVAFYPAK